METQDPLQSLTAGDVAERSAAARDLAHGGTQAHIDPLLDAATADKSSAVRLYAAGAVSAILSRHRGLPGHEPLEPDVADRVIQRVCAIDPSLNPPLLMALASLRDKRVVPRLGRMLRDPRNAVRHGAMAALRMRVLSAAFFDDTETRVEVGKWLVDRRMPLDMAVELARLVGDAGWGEYASSLPRRAGVGEAQLEIGDLARERLAQRARLDGWDGLWQSDGLDVLEVNANVSVPEWCVVGDGLAASARGSAALMPTAEGLVTLWGARWRMIWAHRTGLAEASQALQCEDGRTFYRLEGASLIANVVRLQASLVGAPAQALLAAADSLLPGVDATGKPEPEESGVPLARALLAWRAGRVERALEDLDLASKDKKTKFSAMWWRAQVVLGQGEREQARELLETYLLKAPKKAQERDEVRELLASLG